MQYFWDQALVFCSSSLYAVFSEMFERLWTVLGDCLEVLISSICDDNHELYVFPGLHPYPGLWIRWDIAGEYVCLWSSRTYLLFQSESNRLYMHSGETSFNTDQAKPSWCASLQLPLNWMWLWLECCFSVLTEYFLFFKCICLLTDWLTNWVWTN